MMYKKFKKFLRKHKCSRAFNRNVRKAYADPRVYSPESHFLFLGECAIPAQMIGTSFIWNETIEGEDFWMDIGMKWLKECR